MILPKELSGFLYLRCIIKRWDGDDLVSEQISDKICK